MSKLLITKKSNFLYRSLQIVFFFFSANTTINASVAVANAPAAVATDLETIYQGEDNGEGGAGSGQGGLRHTVLPACSYPRLSQFHSFEGTFPALPSCSSDRTLVP